MSRQPGLQTDPANAPARPHLNFAAGERGWWGDEGAGELPAVLIEVPAVRPNQHAARRPSEAATARLRAHGAAAVTARPRRRRRLRREIRVAGYVVASALPLALAVALLHGSRAAASHTITTTTVASGAPVEVPTRPPAVSIMIDPAASGRSAEPEPPVVLPGYLLPDDGAEEGSHGGG